MRTATMILAGVMASGLSWGGDLALTVCLPFHPQVEYKVQVVAQDYASRVYRSVGVNLRWKTECRKDKVEAPGTPYAPNLTVIGIQWKAKAPASVPPTARASAFPFQPTGARVALYLDRLEPVLQEPVNGPAVLGHVLAHEIGHVLLGYDGHSRDGLMKAVWSAADQRGMKCRSLTFSPDEADVIRHNLMAREQLIAAFQDERSN